MLVAALVMASAIGVWLYQRYTPARRGERRFAELGCTGCHFSGAGPNLTHVIRKHDRALLERFIPDSPSVYRERKGAPLNAGYMLMPKGKATAEDVQVILAYLQELDRN
jgi:hypothetical protein